jgi:phosphatidylserine decarboxylase
MSALTYATAKLLRLLPRERISRACGQLADARWPDGFGRAFVNLYGRVLDVDFEECEPSPEAPQRGWESFDAFFTRPLKDGRRPIAGDARTIVSPADGRIVALDTIGRNATFQVKGRPYDLNELLGDPAEADRYIGGTGCVVYLSPRDYHRVHSPVAGVIRHVRSLPGDYYPVNAIGERHVENLFAVNRRVVIAIDTPEDVGLGRVTVVMVAAIVVGRVTVTGIDERDVSPGEHPFQPPLPVERGGEIGMFHLGSTAVVFIEGRSAPRAVAGLGPVLYGAPLAIADRARTVEQPPPSGPAAGAASKGDAGASRSNEGAGA